eukprot:GFUD01021983.1.p1 GENE.GFUD01021983.1~~GFUD01021983.1.p1  ORF type:complete len:830 (-),score=300.05 GFUD01021983.1:470-2959(-)
MAKFFNSAASMISMALSKNTDPNQVREVSSSQFSKWPVRRREDCLLLYGPYITEKKSDVASFKAGEKGGGDVSVEKTGSYELVVQSDRNFNNCFSLFRTGDISEAEARFEAFVSVIPAFLTARPELCCSGSLQKLCDCIREHQDWGLCHLVVSLDMVDLVAEDRFKVEIDMADSAGVTPLMLAVNQGSKHLVVGLLNHGASLQGSNVVGCNVFHSAAAVAIYILDILVASEQATEEVVVPLLNQCNADGNTPLHLACQADKPDIVKAMLCAGADVNTLGSVEQELPLHTALKANNVGCVREILEMYPNQLHTKDMKYGGTPLHWSTEKPILDGLIGLGCNIEARNFTGATALHTMVKHKRLPCAVCLLSHGALVDQVDSEGNTALHLAVVTGHVPSIQALLIFGADYKMKNKDGDNPWLLALKTHQSKFAFNVEKERNMVLHTLHALGAQGPSDLSNTPKDFDWKPPVTEKNHLQKRCRHLFDEFLDKGAMNVEVKKGGVKILSLDGGGIRGLVLVKILDSLTKFTNQPITSMFDWIIGTSTGGILSLALAVGKSPMECQGLYFKLKDKVFVGKRPYDIVPMEAFLKNEFTEELMMSQLPPKPFIAVTGTLADRYPADLHLFRNYTSPMDILGVRESLLPSMSPVKKPDQQTVWRAARSSGAAPTYFRAAGRFIDGGLVANNPTLDILTEIHERNAALRGVGRMGEVQEIGCVVSLGTGDPPTEKVDSIDLFRPDSIMGVSQLLFGMSAMGRLLVDQASSAGNRVVDRARAWCSMANIAYMRLSPQLASDIPLDETSDEVLVEMLWMTQVYMHEQRGHLQELVTVLNKC